MKRLSLSLLIALPLAAAVQAAVQDREAEQARLDASCTSAQQQLISQGKQQQIDACIQEGGKEAKCQQASANFGQRVGNKRPNLNELAPCQQAEAYRKSYRQ